MLWLIGLSTKPSAHARLQARYFLIEEIDGYQYRLQRACVHTRAEDLTLVAEARLDPYEAMPTADLLARPQPCFMDY